MVNREEEKYLTNDEGKRGMMRKKERHWWLGLKVVQMREEGLNKYKI